MWPRTKTLVNFENILKLMLSWKKSYTAKVNVNKKPYTQLSIADACAELWLNRLAFHQRINNHPELKEKYLEMREAKRNIIKDDAESNLEKAIWWKLDIADNDLANLSLRFLEKTDKNYNPKQDIDIVSKNLNFNVSDWEIMEKIYSLMWK